MHPSANSAFSFSTFVDTDTNADANANANTTTTTTTSTTSTTTTNHRRASSTTDSALPIKVGSPSENSRNESEVFGLPHKPGHKPGLSQENGQSSDSGNNSAQAGHNSVSGHLEDQRTKKRRTGPSPRGVANLTPEQLAKKRANDREAQRAIRERTKIQIETLERRIRELTSQKPYQELQAAIHAKEAVEAENAEIKSRLASVLSLIQPVLSDQQVQGAYASPISTIPSNRTTQRSPSISHSYNDSTPTSAASPSVVDSSSQTQSQVHLSPHLTQVMLNQQRHDLFHNLDLGAGEQLKLDFLLDPSHRINRMPTGINGPQDTLRYQHPSTRHGWNFGLLPPPRDHSAVNSGPHRQQQHCIEYAPRNVFQPIETYWVGNAAPIKNGPSTCPLDSLLLEFLQERRQRAAEGVPTPDIVGPKYPSVSSLLNPANSVFSHPLSKVFTDILAAFPGISGLPERVAVLYYMFLVMRWQVSPTQENYDLLPHFALPTPAQLHITHPAWIDHLPFPHMREKLAKEYNPTDFLFDNFFIPFTTTISLNWPYEPTDTLLQSPDGNELLINPVFERHLRRFENWTLGEPFDTAFPLLRGTYNLKRSSPLARNMADGQFNGG
ncbi:hypothetical protein F4811DRAFT_114955 [Daldinia bambusicola]|nr:hypothetical protein F4811DRAFT_114955 [Daldinia bambusicola]